MRTRSFGNPVRVQTLKRMATFASCVPAGFALEKMTKCYRQVLNQYAGETTKRINLFSILTSKQILKEAHTEGLITDDQMALALIELENSKGKKVYLNTYQLEGFTRRCPVDCPWKSLGDRTRCRAGYEVRAISMLMYHKKRCGYENYFNSRVAKLESTTGQRP